MTTEHDFQKALNAYESNTYDTPQEWVSCAGVIGDKELDETIRFALRLADKLLGQEPSIAAIDSAKSEFNKLEKSCNEVGERLSWEGGALVVFESMLATAVTELEQSK